MAGKSNPTRYGDLLTPDEMARALGVKRKTIYDHATSGKLPCRRIYTGAPRFEPLVRDCLREGGSEALAKMVQDAIDKGLDRKEIEQIWRCPPGRVVPMPTRTKPKRKASKNKDQDAG